VTDNEARSGPAPTRGATDRDADLRRRQIAAVARTVFAAEGSSVSVRDVAKAAGITEAAIYRLFSSKRELFEAAILLPLEELARDLGRVAEQFMPASLHERMNLGQEFQRQLAAVVRRITPLLGSALYSETGREFYRERMAPLLEQAGQVTSLAMSPVTRRTVDPRTVFIAMMGMYLGLAADARLGGDEEESLDWEEASRALTELVAFGLLDPRPHDRLRDRTGRPAAAGSDPAPER